MASLSSSSATTQDGRRIVANKPVDVALNEIVARARVFTDAGGAAIALRDGDEIVTRASSGGIAPDVGTRMSVEGSLTGQALLKGIPIHVENSDTDPRVDAETCRALSTRSFIITPIAGSTTMLGVLAVFAPSPNAFTRTDLAVLRTMSDQISAALGGGAFMQQAWPSTRPQDESQSAAWDEPQEDFRAQAVAPVVEPTAPLIADVEFESLKEPERANGQKNVAAAVEVPALQPSKMVEEVIPEPAPQPEPIKLQPAKPVIAKEPVAPPVAPVVPVVEPKPKEEVTPLAQEIEVASPSPVKSPPRSAEPPKVDETPRKGRMKPQSKARPVERGMSLEEIRSRAKLLERPAKADEEAREKEAARAEVAEWKGLSTPEPESRSMARFIVAGIAVVVVGGAIAAAVVMHKPPSTSASVPAAAVSSPGPTGVTAADTKSAPQSNLAAGTKTPAGTQAAVAATTAAKNEPKQVSAQTTQPAAAPAQEPIVLAPGARPQKPVEEAAPPQLAFSGAQPKLMETTAAMPVAVPKRATSSEPIPPQLVRRVAPAYPEMARRLRQKGNVELQALILKDGSVGKVDVLSGAMLLRSAAIDAVKQWKYRPAQISGAAVESQVKIVIAFDTAQ